MGDMDSGASRSPAQSLAAAQAARSSYNQQHVPQGHQYTGANNGDTAVEIERRGRMKGDDEEQYCTVNVYPYYFRKIVGILRVVELVLGIIVVSAANAEQCVLGTSLCGSPSSPAWYGELGGQGYVLFVGIVFIFGNIALILYHLLVKPSAVATSAEENVRLGELIYNGVAVILYIIAASVEAWYASWTRIPVKVGADGGGSLLVNGNDPFNPYRPQWIAAAVFAWFNVAVYAADLVYMYFFDGVDHKVSNTQ